MNLNRGSSIVALTLLIALTATGVFAAVPLVMSYQGRLLDAGDQPLTGSYTMIFQIYDVPVGGAPLWTEDHVGVSVADGLFSVALGATVPLSADLLTGSGGGGSGGSSRYLQIQIAGQPAISPRTRLSAAPYAVASGSVSGDIQTAPGRVYVVNVPNDKRLEFAATNDSASITIDEAGTRRVKLSSSGGSGGGSGGGMISITGDPDFDLLRLAATQDSAKIRISGQSIGDPDFDLLRIVGGTGTGTAGASVTITGDPDFDLLRMSADHDSAKIRFGGKIAGDPDFDLLRLASGSGASHLLMQSEPSGVDARSQSLDAICDNTNARLAVQTKGTSAKREIRHNTDSLIAESSVAADLDGDGLEDNIVSSSADATGSRMAIKTKGTGAQRAIRHLTDALITESSVAADLDGDSVDDLVVVASTDATSAKHAINTKGTGAQAGKSASISMQATPGGNASVAGELDSDGDGIPDKEISQLLTPTTSSVAIKTKGTGADANRTATISSGTGVGSAFTYLDIDDDGDNVPESEISKILTPTTSSMAIKTKGTGADKNRIVGATDDTSAVVLLATDDASITMAVRKGGVVNGSIIVNNASAVRAVGFGSDGNGFFATGVGVGVDPTHAVDVAGGAYCDGANWVNASDVNSKENFQPVNGSELLDQIEQLAITRWNYKGNDQAEHIGPTAQDFKAAFGVGADDKSISTIDPSGIALAAIKALRIESKNKTQQLNELQNKVQQLEAIVEKLLSEKK